ncbi:MAG: metallophosphatase family protein [Clostridia bacterium]|nr:metallophosphatase family protein [Clostridia bacterium]
MRIERLNEEPVEYINYKTVADDGHRVIDVQLPIIIGKISGLPEYLDALIITSDLQGIFVENEREMLLGEAIAEFLPLYTKIELGLSPKNIGVFLCGDLYATLEKKGGLGDVRAVWNKFNNNFKWVGGVAGNHDSFGSEIEFDEFKKREGIFYFDREIQVIENMKTAGISGIIGKQDRVNRIREEDYLKILEKLLMKRPDILLLHQTPNSPIDNLKGEEKIRSIVEKYTPTLAFCGHYHWKKALTELCNGTQVLNVDSRAAILINCNKV